MDTAKGTGRHLFTARTVTAVMPRRGGGETTVFRGLSFDVDGGEVVDVTGPSGSGKSTLLTAFARLNVHTSGTFALDGRDSDTFTPQRWRSVVAYLPQTPTLIGDTVADAIRLPWTLKVRHSERTHAPKDLLTDAHIRATLDDMGCADIADETARAARRRSRRGTRRTERRQSRRSAQEGGGQRGRRRTHTAPCARRTCDAHGRAQGRRIARRAADNGRAGLGRGACRRLRRRRRGGCCVSGWC